MRKIQSIYAVTPGSLWADRSAQGRTVLITAIDGRHAICTTLTNSYDVQRIVNNPSLGNARDMRGTTHRIHLDRFRPTHNGFEFVTATAHHLSALLSGTR
ncbi:hypothetical protein [Microbispora sp. NPDC049125]|uniref:hypothetical protein n=1 Tax=Microbispora sp. NPDC049125 TaxID=3154929 RepID=UPI003467B9A7